MAIKFVNNSRLEIGKRKTGFRFSMLSWVSGGILSSTISAGNAHFVALREDGTIKTTGCDTYEQRSPAESWTDIITVTAGGVQTLALDKDFNLKSCGKSDTSSLPSPAMDVLAGKAHHHAMDFDGVVHETTGYYSKLDGADYGCGTECGGCNKRCGLSGGGCVAASGTTCIAWLLEDGTIDGVFVDEGYDGCGKEAQWDDWSDIVKLAGSQKTTIGLTSEGKVKVSSGKSYEDFVDDSLVEGWENIVDIAAGFLAVGAVTKDGKVLVTESEDRLRQSYVDHLSDVIAIDIKDGKYGPDYSLIALKSDGTAEIVGSGGSEVWEGIRLPSYIYS